MFNWLKKLSSFLTVRLIKLPPDSANGSAAQIGLLNESASYKNRGDQYFEQDKLAAATECYRQAVSINPGNAEALSSLGIVFFQQDLFEDAERHLKQAILADPKMAKAYYFLGATAQKQGKLNEAIENFNKALQLKPDAEIIYRDLCYALFQSGQNETAKKVVVKGIGLNPNFADFHSFLGNLHYHEKEFDKAIACYQKALSIQPSYVEVYANLGKVFKELGKLNEAIDCYRKALELKPDSVDAHVDLGIMLNENSRTDEAIAYYRKALVIDPDFVDAHYNLGVVLQNQKPDAAVDCYRKVLALRPENYTARANMLHQLQHMCEWGDLKSSIQAVRRAVMEEPAGDNNRISPFSFMAMPGTTVVEQKRCAEKWAQSEYQLLVSNRKKLGFEFKRTPNNKIAIGYLSADFRQHAVSFLMAEVFELHDRSRFQVTAYSYGPNDGSEMRKRLKMAFDNFVDIRHDTYEEAAKKIYADRTDILVDLTGYTQNSRSGILALRPAPIQVNYLGYPGTMGADFVDYLIADRFTIPPEHQMHYTEKVIWLPDCFQANDRTRPRLSAPTRKECGLPEEGVVFCCFNQTYKISPEFFDIWCRLLKAVPGSVLWLPACNPHAEGNLRREAENHGVAAERIIMALLLPRDEHLARLQCADLFLDTLPYNAGTTCSDALWMGLPVITCAGDAFVSRMAGSLITAIGVPELITFNLEDYYSLAIDLATDKKKREGIRNKIISNRDAAPLFDSERFTRNLEEAFTKMMASLEKNHL